MAETRPISTAVRVGVAAAMLALLVGCTAAPATEAETGAPAESSAAPTVPEEGSEGDLPAGTAFTPLMTWLPTTPAPVRGTDEKIHLAYEVLVTNAAGLPFQLDRFEVRDAETDATLLTLEGEQLNLQASRLGDSVGGPRGIDPVVIGQAETWIVWIDVVLDAEGDVPTRVGHHATGDLVRPSGDLAPFDMAIGTSAVSDQPATVVAMPVKEGTWLMSEGCCSDDTHHRRGFAPVDGQPLVPQRFAIDFFMLDDEHRTWVGDPTRLESYLSYRQPIVAAAAGTVVRVMDGLPNTTAIPEPPPLPPIENTVGNHVVVEIAPGLYTLYGHMDPGSVRVAVGDEVEQGQELGLIGSSGNSTTPHLHFHVQNAATFFPSDGLPYVFDEFELLGLVTERLWDDNLGLQPTGQMPFEEYEPSTRHDELPLDRTVVRVE